MGVNERFRADERCRAERAPGRRTRCTRPSRAKHSSSRRTSRATPAAAVELAALSTAAAWIGATEALTPPPRLRASVLAAARARSRRPAHGRRRAAGPLPGPRPVASTSSSRTLGAEDLAAMTANGLSVRDLVIHLAAMESMVAAGLGHPVTELVAPTGVEERTAELIDAFALQPIDDVRRLWLDAIAEIGEWGRARRARTDSLPWLGFDVQRDTLLISRAFETWIHANDIRRAIGRPLEQPRPDAPAPDGGLLDAQPARLARGGRAAAPGPRRPRRPDRGRVVGAGWCHWRTAPADGGRGGRRRARGRHRRVVPPGR